MANAQVSFMSRTGNHVNLETLDTALEGLEYYLEGLITSAEKEGRQEQAEDVAEAIELLQRARPDLNSEVLPPEPDPIFDAQIFLDNEVNRAQHILQTEAARRHNEAVTKEAFAIPRGLIYNAFTRTMEEAGCLPDDIDARRKIEATIEERFAAAGWSVIRGDASPTYITRQREPLRKLHAILESNSGIGLTPPG